MRVFDLFRPTPSTERGPDRRSTSGQSFKGLNRRNGADRRGLRFGLTFKTTEPLAPLEEWLAESFPDLHRFTIEDMSEDLSVKHVRVIFANETDRATFREYLKDYLHRYR